MKKIMGIVLVVISLVVNASAVEYKYGALLAGQCTGMGNVVKQMGAGDINNECKKIIIGQYAILEEDKLNYCLNVCLMQNGSKLQKRVSPTAADIAKLQLATVNHALLPQKIDEVTTLVDIKAGSTKEEVVSYFVFNEEKLKESMGVGSFNPEIKELLLLLIAPNVVSEKCQGASLEFLKSGVTYKYIYNLDNKEPIGDIPVSIKDCN